MATEKPKKKKQSSKSSEKPAKTSKPASEPAEAGTGADGQPEMRSALLPLLWLLIPFITVIVYGLLTRE